LLILLSLSGYSQTALSDGAIIRRPIVSENGNAIKFYFHYGVIYGTKSVKDKNGKVTKVIMVSHYGENGLMYTTLDEFAKNEEIKVITKGIEPNSPEMIEFKKRYNSIVTKYKTSAYNAINNNCEHFVMELIYGIHKSFQSDYTVSFVKTSWQEYKYFMVKEHPELTGYADMIDQYINNNLK